jgi:hypothetical protein
MPQGPKVRVAFVKFAGMTIGGSELWLQRIAANLPKNIEVDYYYCDDTPYRGTSHVQAITSEERIAFVKNAGVRVIKFNVKEKDITTLTHDWVDTDFFDVFDENKYDIIQTVKAGPREFPFYKMRKPVVEIVALANRPDTSSNIAWSFHSSSWQRARWIRLGGDSAKSSVLSAPVEGPLSKENYREELSIPLDAIVAGFHQRNDNLIASDIPLAAFSALQKKYPEESTKWHFIIKNGGSRYREQAKELGLTNIHFLPATPDTASVSKFLNTLDIFAHGRKDGETFGAIFVEAMLHGKPCLSHYVKGGANAQPETMGPAGLFAKTKEEYETMLYKLYSNTLFRNRLASKAQDHAKNYYSMEMCIDDLTTKYYEILGHVTQHHKNNRIPYGYSDIGFLYAGDIENKNNIAHHVLVGGVPYEGMLRVLAFLVEKSTSSYVFGDTMKYFAYCSSYFSNNFSAEKIVYATFLNKDDSEKVVYLNNWEEILRIGDTLPVFKKDSLLLGTYVDIGHYENHIRDNPPRFIIVGEIKNNQPPILESLNKEYTILYYVNDLLTTKMPPTKDGVFLFAIAKSSPQILKELEDILIQYRKEAYYPFSIKKSSVESIIRAYVPRYITKEKILAYIRRKLFK